MLLLFLSRNLWRRINTYGTLNPSTAPCKIPGFIKYEGRTTLPVRPSYPFSPFLKEEARICGLIGVYLASILLALAHTLVRAKRNL